MLMVTSNAVGEIRTLLAQQNLPESAGVRIAANPSGQLTLGLATMPAEDDQVVDAAGTHVFLDPPAADALEDKVLDAQSDNTGQVQFSLADQTQSGG